MPQTLNLKQMATQESNRSKRPWIVVMGHRPMYCSTSDNDDCTKTDTYTRVGMPVTKLYGMEDLLYEHSVDLALWAHEHNYERHWPLYNYTWVELRRIYTMLISLKKIFFFSIMNGSEEEPYVNPKATVHITTGSAVNKL